jgi:hypothetical protein
MKNPATTSEEDEDQGIKERRHNPENCLDRVYQYRIHQDELKRTRSVGDKSNSTTKCPNQESWESGGSGEKKA